VAGAPCLNFDVPTEVTVVTPVLRIHCERCGALLAIARPARPGEPAPTLTNRCRWEVVDPPHGPVERWKWYCPNPDCRRTRELRSDRIAATLDAMIRDGKDVADI
jgi:hypothetical protein